MEDTVVFEGGGGRTLSIFVKDPQRQRYTEMIGLVSSPTLRLIVVSSIFISDLVEKFHSF